MAAKEIVVKKYVVRLSCGERSLLETMIRKGSNPAQRLRKARILLKADVSEAGEGWSDNQIIEALATSASMVYRVRKQLVEEGFEAVLSRKPRRGLRLMSFDLPVNEGSGSRNGRQPFANLLRDLTWVMGARQFQPETLHHGGVAGADIDQQLGQTLGSEHLKVR